VQKSLGKAGNQVYLVNFDAPGSGSAFPIRIRIHNTARKKHSMNAESTYSMFFQALERLQAGLQEPP